MLRQNAIPFLFYLADNEGWHAPSSIAKEIGAQTKYVGGTVSRLAAAGLVECQPAGTVAGRPTQRICLTPGGEALVEKLKPVLDQLEAPAPQRRKRTKH